MSGQLSGTNSCRQPCATPPHSAAVLLHSARHWTVAAAKIDERVVLYKNEFTAVFMRAEICELNAVFLYTALHSRRYCSRYTEREQLYSYSTNYYSTVVQI